MTGRTGKPPRERVDLRISRDGLALIDQLAEHEQRSRSDMLRVLIMEALAARAEPTRRMDAMSDPGSKRGTQDG